MVKIEGELLRKLQMTELEMLIEVDRICRKYNIQYFLDGGTLLGAIRHNGFIPWDDDADIIMLRGEYEKFCKACKKELDTERFFLQDYRTDKHYLWGFAKMRRNHTTFLREGQEHVKCHTGVCIDIFYCDNIPDDPLLLLSPEGTILESRSENRKIRSSTGMVFPDWQVSQKFLVPAAGIAGP